MYRKTIFETPAKKCICRCEQVQDYIKTNCIDQLMHYDGAGNVYEKHARVFKSAHFLFLFLPGELQSFFMIETYFLIFFTLITFL